MKQLFESGERHPLRIIGQLNTFEKFNEFISRDGKTDYYNYQKKDIKPFSNVTDVHSSNSIEIKETIRMPTGLPIQEVSDFLDGHIAIPHYYTQGIVDFLRDYLQDKQFDAIIELGAGFGGNLFKLYYNGGPKVPYYAGEFTESGFNCCQFLSALDPELNITPFRFDYRNPNLSCIKENGKIFVFTCHSIEQVDYIPEHLLKTIADCAQEVTCIHMEPFGYQMLANEKYSNVDEIQQKFFEEKNWNRNLFQALLQNHQKHILLEFIGKNILGGHFANPTSVAIWKKKHSQ